MAQRVTAAQLRWRTLALILSPRRNNLQVLLQPALFGYGVSRLFERTAGQRSKFKGYARRSYANRRGLLDEAAFRLLRSHKKDQRFRYLTVNLRSFMTTLGGYRSRRPAAPLAPRLEGLLYPFHRRQLSLRYPIIQLRLGGASQQPAFPPHRSRKHKRAPKLRSYLGGRDRPPPSSSVLLRPPPSSSVLLRPPPSSSVSSHGNPCPTSAPSHSPPSKVPLEPNYGAAGLSSEASGGPSGLYGISQEAQFR